MEKPDHTTIPSKPATNVHNTEYFGTSFRSPNINGSKRPSPKLLNIPSTKNIIVPPLNLNSTKSRTRSDDTRHQKAISYPQKILTVMTALNHFDNGKTTGSPSSENVKTQPSIQEFNHQPIINPRSTTDSDLPQARGYEWRHSPGLTSRTGSTPQITIGSMTSRDWRQRNDSLAEKTNTRCYPSKRLIFQQKIEALKAKIEEKEDINLGEFKDLEDWFETLNLKYNDVLFANTFDIYIYSPLPHETWRPSGREGATLNSICDHIVLYGGVSTGYTDEIAFLEPRSNQWFVPRTIINKPNFNRYGHSAVVYQNYLVIFGGEKQYIKPTRVREVLDEVLLFDVKQGEFTKMQNRYHGPRTIMPRKHHAATINGHKMYVFGGIGDKGQYFNDLWEYNIRSGYWRELSYNDTYEASYECEGIAYHKMCYVVDNYERGLREGLYVFGGKDEDNNVLNSLKLFKLNLKQPQWIYPEVKGQPPSPRYNHTMEYYASLNAFIIYGGRCDRGLGFYELREIKMFNVMVMAWTNVNIYGERPDARYLHSATIYEDKMLIFGGLNNYVLKDSRLLTIDLNPETVSKLAKPQPESDEPDLKRTRKSMINPCWSQEKANQILKIQLTSPITNRWHKVYDTLGEYRDYPSYLPPPKKEAQAKMYLDAMKDMIKAKTRTKEELEQEQKEQREKEKQLEIERTRLKLLRRKRLIKPNIKDVELQNILRYFQKKQEDFNPSYRKG